MFRPTLVTVLCLKGHGQDPGGSGVVACGA